MLVTEFLQKQLNIEISQQDVMVLNKLAGREFRSTFFYPTYEEATKWLYEWMPLYFFPIGKNNFSWIGIHLRPQDIQSKRFAIVKADNNSVLDAEFVEIAPSLKAFIYRELLEWEGELNEDEDDYDEMEDLLALSRELFGNEFYTPGTLEELYFDDQYRYMIQSGRGSPYDYVEYSNFQSISNKDELLHHGLTLYPDCLHLHAKWIKRKYDQGDYESASIQFVKSLACYYHTAYRTDIEDYSSLGRNLFERVPHTFPKYASDMLAWNNPLVRLNGALNLFKDGEIELSAKYLNDFCYTIRNYDYVPVLQALRKHYEKLDWDWAVKLVDIRLLRQKDSSMTGPSKKQSALWEEIVKQWWQI